jgi:chromosomal replication initiation ATPase DnaA
MTTLTPEEVKRLAARFTSSNQANECKTVIERPAAWKSHKIRIRIHRGNRAAAEIMKKEVAKILPILGKMFGVDPATIYGHGRKQNVVYARLMAYNYLQERGYSLALIGRSLDGRDHGTVIMGIKRWKSCMDSMPFFRDAWAKFVQDANE